jgi:hypothetical protein
MTTTTYTREHYAARIQQAIKTLEAMIASDTTQVEGDRICYEHEFLRRAIRMLDEARQMLPTKYVLADADYLRLSRYRCYDANGYIEHHYHLKGASLKAVGDCPLADAIMDLAQELRQHEHHLRGWDTL